MTFGAEFFGRVDELAALVGLVQRADAGRGGIGLVLGEPGIGKTALVDRATRDAGVPTVWAQSREGAPPLWTWEQVWRIACADGLVADEQANAWSSVDPALPGSGVDRFRRFDQLSTRLLAGAARRPFVIVLDDLHWADGDSLALLDFVIPGLAGSPLTILATSRPGELEPLPRTDVLVELGGLRTADLAALIEHETGATPSDEVVAQAARHTGGNPFFVGEVSRLLRAGGHVDEPARWIGVLPQGVRSVLARRFARLPQESHATMTSAAVLGADVDATILAAVIGVERTAVYDRLGPAVRAGLLVESGDGRFRFAHALVQEAALSELDVAGRRALHERAADVIEVTSGSRAAAEIAEHRTAAGDAHEARRWAELAGDRAYAAAMYSEAADWFERAHADDAEPALTLKLADALARCGLTDRAEQAYHRTVRAARRAGDDTTFARAALGIGTLGGGFEVRLLDPAQLALLREALDVLDPVDSAVRSVLMARLSVASTLGSGHDERAELAEQAVAMARRIDHPGALSYALSAWCDAHAGPLHAEQRSAAAGEMLAAAQRAGDLELELLARRFAIVAHMELGEVAQASRVVDAFGRLADQLRQPQFQWYARLASGMLALLFGELDRAFELATDASRLGRSVQSANAHMLADGALLVAIARERGETGYLERYDAANRGHPEAARAIDVLPLFGVGYGIDRESVTGALDALRDGIPIDASDGLFIQAMAMTGDGAAFVGDVEVMIRSQQALAEYVDRLVLDGTAAVCYGPVSITLARIAASRGDPERAAELYERAERQLRAVGAPLLLARVQAERLAGGVHTQPIRAPAEGDRATGELRREGDVWLVAFGGESSRFRHSKGLNDLAQLLPRPGIEVHVLDLVAAAEHHTRAEAVRNSDVGVRLDATARAAYEQRIRDLTSELDEAERHHDTGRIERLDGERDVLLRELAGALGLGGRERLQGSDSERARKAVGMRIRESIARIEDQMPLLGRHLRSSIRTGVYCSYVPEHPVDWRCQAASGAERA